MNQRIDGLTFASLALILFMGFNILRDRVDLGLPCSANQLTTL